MAADTSAVTPLMASCAQYCPSQRRRPRAEPSAGLAYRFDADATGGPARPFVPDAHWIHWAARISWLSCDARDADPATFWIALSATLTQMWPDRWFNVVDLLAEKEPDLDDVAIAVVNDLADLGERVVLVIDGFEFAAAAAPIEHAHRASPRRLSCSGRQPDRAPARAGQAPRFRSTARGSRPRAPAHACWRRSGRTTSTTVCRLLSRRATGRRSKRTSRRSKRSKRVTVWWILADAC